MEVFQFLYSDFQDFWIFSISFDIDLESIGIFTGSSQGDLDAELELDLDLGPFLTKRGTMI